MHSGYLLGLEQVVVLVVLAWIIEAIHKTSARVPSASVPSRRVSALVSKALRLVLAGEGARRLQLSFQRGARGLLSAPLGSRPPLLLQRLHNATRALAHHASAADSAITARPRRRVRRGLSPPRLAGNRTAPSLAARQPDAGRFEVGRAAARTA